MTCPPPFPPRPSGYVSGVHYKMFGGSNWVSNVLLCTALFCGPVLVVFAFLNTVAIFYRVSLNQLAAVAVTWPGMQTQARRQPTPLVRPSRRPPALPDGALPSHWS
jgi:hypothetical protein